MQLLAADAERVLQALLGTGDVSVERDRDLEPERAHRTPPPALATDQPIGTLAGVQPGPDLEARAGDQRHGSPHAQRIARAGPSNVARKPSPVVSTSWPRKPLETARRTTRCGVRAARRQRSVAELGGSPRRVDDVGEQHRRQHAVGLTRSRGSPVRNSSITSRTEVACLRRTGDGARHRAARRIWRRGTARRDTGWVRRARADHRLRCMISVGHVDRLRARFRMSTGPKIDHLVRTPSLGVTADGRSNVCHHASRRRVVHPARAGAKNALSSSYVVACPYLRDESGREPSARGCPHG